MSGHGITYYACGNHAEIQCRCIGPHVNTIGNKPCPKCSPKQAAPHSEDRIEEATRERCAKHDVPVGHLGCECAPCPRCEPEESKMAALRRENERLREELTDLVARCDGEEGVRADGSNIQTMRAHAVLSEPPGQGTR